MKQLRRPGCCRAGWCCCSWFLSVAALLLLLLLLGTVAASAAAAATVVTTDLDDAAATTAALLLSSSGSLTPSSPPCGAEEEDEEEEDEIITIHCDLDALTTAGVSLQDQANVLYHACGGLRVVSVSNDNDIAAAAATTTTGIGEPAHVAAAAAASSCCRSFTFDDDDDDDNGGSGSAGGVANILDIGIWMDNDAHAAAGGDKSPWNEKVTISFITNKMHNHHDDDVATTASSSSSSSSITSPDGGNHNNGHHHYWIVSQTHHQDLQDLAVDVVEMRICLPTTTTVGGAGGAVSFVTLSKKVMKKKKKNCNETTTTTTTTTTIPRQQVLQVHEQVVVVSPPPPRCNPGIPKDPIVYFICDFNTLEAGTLVGQPQHPADRLQEACLGMTVSSSSSSSVHNDDDDENGNNNNNNWLIVTVFNSSFIAKHRPGLDPDYGSPNYQCQHDSSTTTAGAATTGSVGGRGAGGAPMLKDGVTRNPYANCQPLGNVLILEKQPAESNNSVTTTTGPVLGGGGGGGGCMKFAFDEQSIDLFELGLLNVEERKGQTANITLTNIRNESMVIYSPRGLKSNAHWIVNTPDVQRFMAIKRIDVCLPGVTGAVSFMNISKSSINCILDEPKETQDDDQQDDDAVAQVETVEPEHDAIDKDPKDDVESVTHAIHLEGAVVQRALTIANNKTTPDVEPLPSCSPIDDPIYINCDFNALRAGVPIQDQVDALRDDCKLTVSTSSVSSNSLNILDSSFISSHRPGFDPDIGSPNFKCDSFAGPGLGGLGNGGAPYLGNGKTPNPFANCKPLGNVLIIQKKDKPLASNDKNGPRAPLRAAGNGDFGNACVEFIFDYPMDVLDVGLLDAVARKGKKATITFTDIHKDDVTIYSPNGIKKNGHWVLSNTFSAIKKMEVCLPSGSSGAVSFLNITKSSNCLDDEETENVEPPCDVVKDPDYVKCDFSELQAGVALDVQANILQNACGMSVSSSISYLNVFNSSNILSYHRSVDADLGSPNARCDSFQGRGMGGRGGGGIPFFRNGTANPFANCEPLGNLLIVQRMTNKKAKNDQNPPLFDRPNDIGRGGCMKFVFDYPMDIFEVGLLDAKKRKGTKASIMLTNIRGRETTRHAPNGIKDNGHWIMRNDDGLIGIQQMDVCLPGEGAVSFVNMSRSQNCGVGVVPTSRPTPSPSELPTKSPTPSPTVACDKTIKCDFDVLKAGVYIRDQASLLRDSCGLKIESKHALNVFDSSYIQKNRPNFDPDLGSPNFKCDSFTGGPGVGGRGVGGEPFLENGVTPNPFANCQPLRNLLIFQKLKNGKPATQPNDSKFGGCMKFIFDTPVHVLDVGLLAAIAHKGKKANITFTNIRNINTTIYSPDGIKDNGHWVASTTHSLHNATGIKQMEICLPGSGAVSFIELSQCEPGEPSTTKSPTLSPTPRPSEKLPTESPTVSPTPRPNESPTKSPTLNMTPSPNARPTPSPTASLTATCDTFKCDFDVLDAGVAVGDQARLLREKCGLTASSSISFLNVFNSAYIKKNNRDFDPDLGSPNAKCDSFTGGPGAGGRGVGGEPYLEDGVTPNPFANCNPLGNVLIIQKDGPPATIPNDSAYGGCVSFVFDVPVQVHDVGLLAAIEHKGKKANITFTNVRSRSTTIDSPNGVNDNSHWIVSKTHSLHGATSVKELVVCLPGSGAVSFLELSACEPDDPSPTKRPIPSPTPSSNELPTRSPTSSPTPRPNARPTTTSPTSSPTLRPNAPPTPSPTPSPTTSCDKVICNFDVLEAGATVGDQANLLLESCRLTASSSASFLNVFDSSYIKKTNPKFDPDLGSPNAKCDSFTGRGVGGIGVGGEPYLEDGVTSNPFANCEPLGNVLIIQKDGSPATIPNDSAYGGCMSFVFDAPVHVHDVGLLDIDEHKGNKANITFTNTDDQNTVIYSPDGIKDNGHWVASRTHSFHKATGIKEMVVCLPGSGAVSFIEFFENCGPGDEDEDDDEDDDEDENDKDLMAVSSPINSDTVVHGVLKLGGGCRTEAQREELRSCIRWAVGLEHESMLVHKHEDGVEEYAIDANKILREMARYGNIHGLDAQEHIIAVRANDDGAEFSGRRCANCIDFSYKTMMEAVSTDALELSYDAACDQLRKIDATFLKMANLHPFIKKVREEEGLGPITRPSTGMSNQLGMYQRTGGKWFKCSSCGRCSLKDYTGSFHMSLSLPTTPDGWVARDASILTDQGSCASTTAEAAIPVETPFSWLYTPSPEQIKSQQQQEWIEANQNLGNMIQWVEPLLIATHGSADADSVCDNGLYTEGSFRPMRTGWGVPGTTDVRTFKTVGIGRYVKDNFDWMFPDDKTVMPSAYRDDLSGCLKDGMGADIRTKSTVNEHDLPQGAFLPPMEVGRGIEIRIFDNMAIEHVPQIYRMISFVAEAGRQFTAPEYIYGNADWSSAIQSVMREGWNAILPEGYVRSMAAALNLPPSFMESIGKNFHAFFVFTELYKVMWDAHSKGMWSYLLLDCLPTEMPRLTSPNRDSWESGAMKMGYSPDRVVEALGLGQSDMARTIKMSDLKSSEAADSCGEDLEDLVYLAESLGMVSDISVNEQGSVESFFLKNKDEWETSAFSPPVCLANSEPKPPPETENRSS